MSIFETMELLEVRKFGSLGRSITVKVSNRIFTRVSVIRLAKLLWWRECNEYVHGNEANELEAIFKAFILQNKIKKQLTIDFKANVGHVNEL